MVRSWQPAILIAIPLILLGAAGVALCAGAATQPASASTSAPTSEPAAQEWKLPAINKLGIFTVSNGTYAIIEDVPPPPDPNAPPPPAGTTPPPPPKPKWHLLDLKTGKILVLADELTKISADFKGDIFHADFAPSGKGLIVHTTDNFRRQPWYFDLAGKQCRNLADPVGTQCFWMGDMLVVYEPNVSVGSDAKVIDLSKSRVGKVHLPGQVVAISDKGNALVCRANVRFARGRYAQGYAIFSQTGIQVGAPLQGATNTGVGVTSTDPKFYFSPGGKSLLTMIYDDQGGVGIAGMGAETGVFRVSGSRAILADAGSPVFVNDSGKAITRNSKGSLLIWDVKGKESQELATDSLDGGVGVFGGNLYWLTNKDGNLVLHMLPLPQIKETKPKTSGGI